MKSISIFSGFEIEHEPVLNIRQIESAAITKMIALARSLILEGAGIAYRMSIRRLPVISSDPPYTLEPSPNMSRVEPLVLTITEGVQSSAVMRTV